ncbi:MAG: response regulator [Ramlibacter sp.]|nr:response regulator [Ramlibacter sp.]
MNLKVFIVENELSDSQNLVSVLEQAGHFVLGSTTIQSHVTRYLNDLKPDIVLLNVADGFENAATAFATDLEERQIPFILTGSSYTPEIRRIIKKVNPDGFLIKPLSGVDVVAALETAAYRSNTLRAIHQRQEKWVETLLLNILESPGKKADKLLSLVRAFASFVPFDCMVIDTDSQQRDLSALYAYHRNGFNEYDPLNGEDCLRDCKVTVDEYYSVRRFYSLIKDIEFLNGDEFIRVTSQSVYGDKIRKAYQFNSRIWVPVFNNGKIDMCLVFYSKDLNGYNESHEAFMRNFQNILTKVFLNIRGKQIKSGKPLSINPKFIDAPTSPVNSKFEGIVGKSSKLVSSLDQAIHVAPFESSVLVLGETGVGKEALVRAIHNLSERRNGPFIRLNCAAIAPTLIESELFGHEKGSFTGAIEQRMGKFELANNGTLFLDEIGELSMESQAKLLRVLQEREIDRICVKESIKVDVRIIAATNKNLLVEVSNGKFRMDLYYRINVFPITLPPLRERKEDIPELAEHFLKRYNPYHNTKAKISKSALQQLQLYDWAGNIRELEHLIERHVLTSKTGSIDHFEMPEELQLSGKPVIAGEEFKPIAQVDREHILAALARCKGRVSGKNGAAVLLQLPPTTLNSKMKKLGIKWPSAAS